ncbi:MAG TPA: efflux RND transporter periplasmic adaptor subunit [Gammaproteobacteria bacterium]|nr:efflux RND transporter periplasmic adaptor subunit [Gammaproteobacteria bacterium]
MKLFRLLFLSGLVTGGVILGVMLERHALLPGHMDAGEPAPVHVHDHGDDRQQVQYVCPMHPEVVEPAPGSCPICGMDLVRNAQTSAAAEDTGQFPEVEVSPDFVHNFGVRTAIVERGPVARHIEAIGRVSRMPQPRLVEVKPPLAGRLARLTHKETGSPVNKGELLFEVDAPEWRQLQQLYLDTLGDDEDTRRVQLEQRLQALGMSPGRLEQLRKQGQVEQTLKVHAPISGSVVDRPLAQDATVDAQSTVIALGSINRIPVIVSAFEGQGAWIDKGQRITVQVPTLPGVEFTGQVDRTDREINFSTRTLPVYVGFNTADPRIRYGMLVDVTIEAAAHDNVLRIPREALIRTGSGARVIVARGAGRFQPVEVVTGLESEEFIEILSGLQEGQEVVTSGQFLIDSESSLRTGLQRMRDASHAP